MKIPSILKNKFVFVDTFAKTNSVMSMWADKKVRVAYSGGADSDDMMWLLRLLGYDIPAVFYDTGIEYQATKDHIEYMKSIGFEIHTIKAIMPVPTSNKKYGHPFISKGVTDMLERLQHHKFDFINHGNLSFEELYKLYSKCKSALRWWTNNHYGMGNNIDWNKGLKEFLTMYGLPFSVSNRCCNGAKKLPIAKYAKENGIDLMLLGIRKAEGGRRSMSIKSCFAPNNGHNTDRYFPLFWWKKDDKELFESVMSIKHSACYTEYGLKRTGCFGCPFGLNFEGELNAIKIYEPKLFVAANSIFGVSYEWTRKYKEFVKDYYD
jgi:3'-phosphoadenosine 5'-phosphosulfate sulfotransferase (PAPS reductase)/FAD synthetase